MATEMASRFRRRTIMDYVLVPHLNVVDICSSRSPPSPLPCSLPQSPLQNPRLSPPFTSPHGLEISPLEEFSDESLSLSPRSAYSWKKQRFSAFDLDVDEGGCDSEDSSHLQDWDDANSSESQGSDLECDSEVGDGCSLSMSGPTPLRSKRGRESRESRHAPARKKIRMRAPTGTTGYPAQLCAPPTTSRISDVSVLYCAEKSHVDPSEGCPSTPITKCAILHKLRMYFGPYGFVCEKCHHIYPPSYLLHHISKKHQSDLDITVTGKRKKELYHVVVAHLLSSHGVPEDAAPFQLPETLPDAIPGLQAPTLCHPCHTCPEPRWFGWKSLLSHHREQHQDAELPQKHSPQPRYIIRPYRLGCLEGLGGRSKLSDTVILLPIGWTPNSNDRPDQLIVPRERPLVPASAPHLVAIGWADYLQSLKGADIDLLMKLVEMPKEKEMGSFPPKRAALERGLLRVDALLLRYLTDANTFLEACHPSVRRSITSGTKAHYRGLTRQTYLHYRITMTKTLCMLLRVHYFSRLKDQSHLKRLGSFSIASSKQQTVTTGALYDYLVLASDKDEEEFVANSITLVHRLLVSLIRHDINGTRKMECPTDQSLFLLSLRLSPGGTLQFQTANRLTHDCAILQYWFLTIVVHIARLEPAGKDEFAFFSSEHLDIADEMDAPASHSSTEGLDENQNMKDPLTFLEDRELDDAAGAIMEADNDEEEEREDGNGVEEEGGVEMGSAMNILRVIQREKEAWLRTTPGNDYFTPYDRLKSVWFDSAPTAFKESSKIGHAFQSDGTTIIVDAIGKGHQINIVDIGREARRIAIEIEELICQWLPEETRPAFASFPGPSQLSDDLNDASSIFRQKRNATLLEPTIRTAEISLLQSFLSEEDMLAWLKHNEHLLSLFLVAVALTCGIPPRAFQFASLRFDRCPETGSSRGLFLIDGCLAIGKPTAKQSERSQQDCLWFLPPSLASSLLFYLAVLRPVVVQLLTRLRKEVGRQQTHIFCRTVPRTTGSHSWSGDEITQILQRHTKRLDFALSVGLVRQLYTAFFRQYFPGLCEAGAQEDSLVDRQGQHRFYTGQRHYGQMIGNVPRSLGIDLTEARKLGAMSQLLHIIFEFRSPDEHWTQVLQNFHFLPSARHDRHALDTARLLVLCEYGLLSRGAGPPAALRARETLKARPFFKVPTQPGESFGDIVLMQVLHARLFGEGGPRQHHQTPPGGYPVTDVAQAITSIIQAVEEWTEGDYRPVVHQVDLKAGRHFTDVEKLAEKFLQKAKDKWPEEWCKLCQAVRTNHPSNLKRSWSMRGLPEEALNAA